MWNLDNTRIINTQDNYNDFIEENILNEIIITISDLHENGSQNV